MKAAPRNVAERLQISEEAKARNVTEGAAEGS